MNSFRIERRLAVIALIATVGLIACTPPPSHDLILRGGTV